jgi:hypothetical protein
LGLSAIYFNTNASIAHIREEYAQHGACCSCRRDLTGEERGPTSWLRDGTLGFASSRPSRSRTELQMLLAEVTQKQHASPMKEARH